MSVCKLEDWTVKELSDALADEHKENKIISVPMFQRGKSWKPLQETEFIDSLKKGFPVGSLLFYRSVEGGKETYTLTDGLQRCTTIKNFVQNPTEYFSVDDIDDELLASIYDALEVGGSAGKTKDEIKEHIKNFVKEKLDISDIQYSDFAEFIAERYPTADDRDKAKKITEIIKPFLKDYKENYEEIIGVSIPVIVYLGDIGDLPEIFDRINQGGTKLSKYQVFAASWSAEGKLTIKNSEVVDHILKKYDKMVDDGYILTEYDRAELKRTKQFNIFEYVFGFGKYVCDKFPYLFEPDTKDDEINPIGFELLNACLGRSSDEIKNLHSNLLDVDIDVFEEKVVNTIHFVDGILSKMIKFRGNKRDEKNKILHSKNQIISIVASTFREKCDTNNLEQNKKTWKEHKKILEGNLTKHYVYDIIRKEWYDRGAGKIYAIINHNKYLDAVPKTSWETTLNAFFEDYMTRNEVTNVATPREIEKVFLNCIYAPIFSAEDQLSRNFDIEHLAPKNAMKSLLKKYAGKGLPISSIANLCLLPEFDNRSKGDKTIYQDEKYREKVNDLSMVESKYSFTKENDLEWLDLPYEPGDFDVLKEYYTDFLRKRFESQKEKFYESLGIM